MSFLKRMNTFCMATLLLATPWAARAAGEGHDHGEAPTQTAQAAAPRFSAVSETFELVGVLQGQRLSLYLDRAADNSPVKDARLELELGGAKVAVTPRGEGEFEVLLAQPLAPGITPVAATVIAGQESDLLAGELDLQAGSSAAAAEHAWDAHALEYGAWLLAALLLLALLVVGSRRLRTK